MSKHRQLEELKKLKESLDSDREAYAQLLKEKEEVVTKLEAEVAFLKRKYRITKKEMGKALHATVELRKTLMRRLE